MNERETLIQNISAALPIAQQMSLIEEEVGKLHEEREKKKKIGVGLIILLIIAVLCVLYGFVVIVATKHLDGLFNVVLGVIPFVAVYKRLQRAKECLIKIEELKEKYQGMQNDSNLSWLPMDYRSSFCISEIATYVQNGRADTLKEAINLFETEQHNQRLENAAALGAYWGVLTGSLY